MNVLVAAWRASDYLPDPPGLEFVTGNNVERLRAVVRLVFVLASGAPGETFFLGSVSLAGLLGCSQRTALNVLHQLEALGILRRVATGGLTRGSSKAADVATRRATVYTFAGLPTEVSRCNQKLATKNTNTKDTAQRRTPDEDDDEPTGEDVQVEPVAEQLPVARPADPAGALRDAAGNDQDARAAVENVIALAARKRVPLSHPRLVEILAGFLAALRAGDRKSIRYGASRLLYGMDLIIDAEITAAQERWRAEQEALFARTRTLIDSYRKRGDQ